KLFQEFIEAAQLLPKGKSSSSRQTAYGASAEEEKRNVSLATQVRMYFDHQRDKFWMREADEQTWMTVATAGAKAELKRLFNIFKQRADDVIHAIRRHFNVQYAASLAGYKAGIYSMFGKRILVTDGPNIVQPVRGKWPVIDKLLSGMFTKEQQ